MLSIHFISDDECLLIHCFLSLINDVTWNSHENSMNGWSQTAYPMLHAWQTGTLQRRNPQYLAVPCTKTVVGVHILRFTSSNSAWVCVVVTTANIDLDFVICIP